MNKKIVISVVLVLSLILSLATVAIAEEGFKLNARVDEWTENQEFSLYVSVENNPGIAGFGYSILFDATLIEPIKVERTEILGGGMTTSKLIENESEASDTFNVAHLAFENAEGDGDIHKITFKLSNKVTSANSQQTVEIKLAENPTGLFYNDTYEEVVPVYGSTSVVLPVIEDNAEGETEEDTDTETDDGAFEDISDEFNDYLENSSSSSSSSTTGSGSYVPVKKYNTIIVLTIDSVNIKVNNNTLINDVAPIIVNDRTMLPIRVIAEELGAKVDWDEAQQKVTVTKDDKTIRVYIDSDTAYVNDEVVKLDSPAFIQNSRTYLPLRFISENLGAEVDWDGDLQQVTVKK